MDTCCYAKVDKPPSCANLAMYRMFFPVQFQVCLVIAGARERGEIHVCAPIFHEQHHLPLRLGESLEESARSIDMKSLKVQVGI